EALAAFVGNPAQCFLVDEAGFRKMAIGAASKDVAGELEMIGSRIVATQTELEAILAARGTVASAGGATAHVKSSDQFMAKADVLGPVDVLHRKHGMRLLPTRLDNEDAAAVLLGRKKTARIQRRYLLSFKGKFAQRSHIALAAIGVLTGDDN